MIRTLSSVSAVSILAGLMPVPAQAGEILSGTVSYDVHSSLYTYDYTLNNTSTEPINVLDIQFTRGEPPIPRQLSIGSPPGWGSGVFGDALGKSTGVGWFVNWDNFGYSDSGLEPDQSLAGFSITTLFAPSSLPGPNYEIRTQALIDNPGVLEIGTVVAPLYSPSIQTPEPATVTLAAFGFCIVGCLRRVKRRATSSATPDLAK